MERRAFEGHARPRLGRSLFGRVLLHVVPGAVLGIALGAVSARPLREPCRYATRVRRGATHRAVVGVATLFALDLFAGLNDEQQSPVARAFPLAEVDEGAHLFDASEAGGEVSLLSDTPFSATAVATEDVVAGGLGRAALKDLTRLTVHLGDDPALWQDFRSMRARMIPTTRIDGSPGACPRATSSRRPRAKRLTSRGSPGVSFTGIA